MQFTFSIAALAALLASTSVSAIPFQVGTLEDCATAATGLVYATKANFDGKVCRSQNNWDNDCNTIILGNDFVSAVRNNNGRGLSCTIYQEPGCGGNSLLVPDGTSFPDLSQTTMNDAMSSFRCQGDGGLRLRLRDFVTEALAGADLHDPIILSANKLYSLLDDVEDAASVVGQQTGIITTNKPWIRKRRREFSPLEELTQGDEKRFRADESRAADQTTRVDSSYKTGSTSECVRQGDRHCQPRHRAQKEREGWRPRKSFVCVAFDQGVYKCRGGCLWIGIESTIIIESSAMKLNSNAIVIAQLIMVIMYTTIKTSQRNFVTDPEIWLGQSIYFKNLFSGKWGDKQEDGSYFIETDAHIFEHILRYLRTGVLPVFYDRGKGHDFALYQALLEEAKYFVIERLEKWLCERKYLEVVEIHYLATETQDRESSRKHTTSDPKGRTFMVEDHFVEITTSSNMETTMVPLVQQQNSFYCPNGKHGKSNEEYCRSCIEQARDNKIHVNGGWREEDQLKWCIVRNEVVFHHDLCVNAYLEDALP